MAFYHGFAATLGLFTATVLAPAQTQDQAPPPAFVEVVLPAGEVWVQQRLELVLRIGYDATFFAEQGIALFQQRLDLPFQVLVPWLQAREDRAVQLREGAVEGPKVAVGDRVLRWTLMGVQPRQGRNYTVIELRCDWLPLGAGESVIEPVELKYAFATRFEEHFLRGRQPLDREDAVVASPTQRLRVRDLPTAGRPPGFAGAVGDFAVEAAASVASVRVGGTFMLEVTIRGAGNLERLPPLPWPKLPGFVVQGLVEAGRNATGVVDARRFQFDVLAVRAEVHEVPPISFAFFAPGAGAYQTVQTSAVPLLVEPAVEPLPPRVQQLVAADAAELAAGNAWPWWAYALLAATVAGAMGLAAKWRARRQRGAALVLAVEQLAAGLAAGPGMAGAAFAQFCSACTGEAAPFGEGATGGQQLLARGVPAALVERLRTTHAAFEAARYGGVVPTAGDVLGLARETVRALV